MRATTRSLTSGALLAEVTTLSFDPGRRRLVGREVSYTGQTRTNTWDYRWSSPVEVETGQRKITQEYNRDETEMRTRTVIKSTGETLDQGNGPLRRRHADVASDAAGLVRPGHTRSHRD